MGPTKPTSIYQQPWTWLTVQTMMEFFNNNPPGSAWISAESSASAALDPVSLHTERTRDAATQSEKEEGLKLVIP